MRQARQGHSSCHQAAYLYVFCGELGNDMNETNSVEKLAITADPNLQITIKWELIPQSNLTELPYLVAPFSVGLNNEEILIFGSDL